MFDLVKASIAGAIVTNSLFMLGMALLLGGLQAPRAGVQRGHRATAGGMLFLAAVALLIPSAIGGIRPAGRRGTSCSNSASGWPCCCW